MNVLHSFLSLVDYNELVRDDFEFAPCYSEPEEYN